MMINRVLIQLPRPELMNRIIAEAQTIMSTEATNERFTHYMGALSIRAAFYLAAFLILASGFIEISSKFTGERRAFIATVAPESISVREKYEIDFIAMKSYNISLDEGASGTNLRINSSYGHGMIRSNDKILASTSGATDDSSSVPLDFFIAGFPKCGTTSLQEGLGTHVEIAMPESETNVLTTPGTDQVIRDKMMNVLLPLVSQSTNVKYGIKNPMGLGKGLNSVRAVQRMQRLFPNTKLIIGLRHPVLYLQSFYNYRVMNHYRGDGITGDSIPSFESILTDPWASVSIESARFETILQNLGKTASASSNSSSATPNPVFLYTIEQLQDRDEERKEAFRDALAAYLGLERPIPPLPHSNKYDVVFNETIDICDDKYAHIRSMLVENGKQTQRWILEEFIQSPDVTVANEEHFFEALQTFGSDPCETSTN